MDESVKRCKDGLLRMAALLDKLPEGVRVISASYSCYAEDFGPELLISEKLQMIADAHGLEVERKESNFPDRVFLITAFDGVNLVQADREDG